MQQLLDVIFRLGGVVGRRGEYLIVFVKGISEYIAARTAAQQIHELVTGDGLHPRRQRLFRVVGMAFVVNRQEQFLQQILDLVRKASEPPSQIGSHMRRELVQEHAVGRRVTGETLQHQASEALLNQLHLNLLVTAQERGESFSTRQRSPQS